jgi:hypothetical protein
LSHRLMGRSSVAKKNPSITGNKKDAARCIAIKIMTAAVNIPIVFRMDGCVNLGTSLFNLLTLFLICSLYANVLR